MKAKVTEVVNSSKTYDAYLCSNYSPLLKGETYETIENYVLDNRLAYVTIVIVEANTNALAVRQLVDAARAKRKMN